MKKFANVFQCNADGCEKEIAAEVLIAENQEEWDKIKRTTIPPFAFDATETFIIKQYDCLDNCVFR